MTFTDPKLGIDESRDVLYAAPIADGAVAVDWQNAQRLDVAAAELRRDPASAEAAFEPLPAAGAAGEELRGLAEVVLAMAVANRTGRAAAAP